MSYTNPTTHLYYDIRVTNTDQVGATVQRPQIKFNETRSVPYIERPEDWCVSVVRFEVDTYGVALPLMVPTVQIGQPLQNLLEGQITFKYGAVTAGANLIFIPENKAASLPTPPLTAQDNSQGYYNLNSFQSFIEIINNSFSSALSFLKGLVPALNVATNRPPFIQIDQQGYCYIYAQQSLYDSGLGVGNYIEIYFDEVLYNYLSSFQYDYYGDGVLAIPKARYRLRVYGSPTFAPQNTFSVTDGVGTFSTLVCFQDFVALQSWNPVSGIVFKSQILPIKPSLTGVPLILGASQSQQQIATSNVVLNLTDLVVNNPDGKQYKPGVLYAPTAEFRLIDLFGTTPLYTIDIEVEWVDNFGNSYPLILAPGASATMKILFRKKDFQQAKIVYE
jgi:hypothetical protein